MKLSWFAKSYLSFEISYAVVWLGLSLIDLARIGITYYAGALVVVVGAISLGFFAARYPPRPAWAYVLVAVFGWYGWWNLGWAIVGYYDGGYLLPGGMLPQNIALLGAVYPPASLPLWAFFLTTFAAVLLALIIPLIYGRRTGYDPSNGKRRR